MNLFEPIIGFQEELVNIRRDIHAHLSSVLPNIGTSQVVSRKLKEWGIPTLEGLAERVWLALLKREAARKHWPASRYGCIAHARN